MASISTAAPRAQRSAWRRCRAEQLFNRPDHGIGRAAGGDHPGGGGRREGEPVQGLRVPAALALPTRSTVGAYRVAARATAVASTVASPTSTIRAGFSRSSSAAVDAGRPSGRVSSTLPPSRAAAVIAPWPTACEVPETRKTTGAVVPVGNASREARTAVAYGRPLDPAEGRCRDGGQRRCGSRLAAAGAATAGGATAGGASKRCT